MSGRGSFASLAFAIALAGCERRPPVVSASGDKIESVSFEESFPLSTDVKVSTLHGARLRQAVALMDEHDVLARRGERKASGVIDKSTLTIVVRVEGAPERRLVLRSCSDADVCAFFEEAAQKGVVEHKPLVCRSSTPCDASR